MSSPTSAVNNQPATLIAADAQAVQDYVSQNSNQYQMKPIVARAVKPEEIGQRHITYVRNGEGLIQAECSNVFTENHILVQFPKDLTPNGTRNEWLVKKPDFEKKYGTPPTDTNWTQYQKKSPDNLAVITDELMSIFGAQYGQENIEIGVDWAEDGKMLASKGGLATGYHVIAPSMAEMMYDKL